MTKPQTIKKKKPRFRWKLVLLVPLVILLAGAIITYHWATRPHRVRQFVEDVLNQVTNGQVRVASAQFSLSSGVELFGVQVADPLHADKVPFQDRVVMSCPRLAAGMDVGSMFRGRLQFRTLTADGAECVIVRDEDSQEFNISRIFPSPEDRDDELDLHLPTLDVSNAHVVLARRNKGRLTSCDEIRLDVRASPRKSLDWLIDVDWETVDDRHAQGRSVIDLRTLTFSDLGGGLPWVSLDAISLLLESRFAGIDEFCEWLDLRGSIRADQFEISLDPDHHQLTSAVIHLKDASIAIPLEEGTAPEDRYLRVTSMDGKVICRPDSATAQFEADFGGGRAKMTVDLLGDMSMRVPIEQMGARVELLFDDVSLPEFTSPQRERMRKYIERWPRAKRAFDRYEPYGLIDVEILLMRPEGPDQRFHMDRMVVRGVDASASYQKVPYRVSHITGQVVMTPERYEFEEVGGTHGAGTVVANGGCDGALPHVACDMDIEGKNISVDRDLYDALRPQQQRLWDRFQPTGVVDLAVHASRPELPKGRRGKWKTTVNAQFLDGSANYVGFPYPLENLSGTLTISDLTMTLGGITAKAGQGDIHIEGDAVLTETVADHFDLSINANGIVFDDVLSDAMPNSLRQRVALFEPTGTFDIAGRLMMKAENEELDYDMTVTLNGGSAIYEKFPLKIHDLQGRIRLRPKRIDLIDLTGRRGESQVKVSGSIDLTGTPTLELLNVECRALMLDTECRAALPAEVVRALEGFAWAGPIDVRTTIRARPELSMEAIGIETVIEAKNIDARYHLFDLPLEAVTGRVKLSQVIDRSGAAPQTMHVDIEGIVATHQGGQIQLDGTIDSKGGGTLDGDLILHVDNLQMSESLRDALPRPIQHSWTNLHPNGRFDWSSDRFRFYRGQSGSPLEWDVAGRLIVRGASMDLGIPLRSIDATMDTRISGPSNNLVLAGGLALERVEAMGHLISGATGKLILAGNTKKMLIDEINGAVYGGNIVGRVDWDGSKDGQYALTLTASHINMADYFQAKSKGSGSTFSGPGKMAGLLRLEGQVGNVSTRRGTAQVKISEAKFYKLPILLSIFDVINWVEPDDSAFHDVNMSMLINGQQVEFEEIALEGRSIALVGTGGMRLPGQQLDLTFLTTSAGGLGRVPLVTEILSGTLRELVEIRVSGTLNSPKVTATPFRAIEGTVRTLFEKRRVSREEKLKRRDRSRPVAPNP